MKHVLSVLVENQAGVLNKITGLFARRAFNIESLAVGVTDDKVGSHSAVDLVKAAVAALGGQGGGGRADMAQGGGPNGGAANDAVAAVKAALA